jgi:hypothetical protein
MTTLEFIKNIALLTGIADFLIYVAFIWGRYGIQRSISISFYDLPMDYKIIFRLFIWILSAAIFLCGIGWENPLFFISGPLLSLVGIFTRIKVKWKYVIHMIGAIGGIISCFVAVMMCDLKLGVITCFASILGFMLAFFFGKKEHMIWNVEVVCFATLMSSLLYLNNMIPW